MRREVGGSGGQSAGCLGAGYFCRQVCEGLDELSHRPSTGRGGKHPDGRFIETHGGDGTGRALEQTHDGKDSPAIGIGGVSVAVYLDLNQHRAPAGRFESRAERGYGRAVSKPAQLDINTYSLIDPRGVAAQALHGRVMKDNDAAVLGDPCIEFDARSRPGSRSKGRQ